ncbi:MAG: riboflavin biosynthesis protein RibD [Candidatus Marinimicrobia bacterium]|nr:riboflavin biosynthesis protein RibD [Candidatus Neomarinimicrobiota bacterium]
MNSKDTSFMKIAIDEALKGRSSVYPNPRVGAIVVYKDEIISTGYHENFGGPHAEEIAIKNITDTITDATLYVTLEPCIHQGKTDPCVQLIDSNIFSRIVIGTRDPNRTAGGGIEKLREMGFQVDVDICSYECKKINRRFFTFHEKKRPYIILKIASTLDGFIAQPDGISKWITNEFSRDSVHELRATCDAILVGNGTIEKDDPDLSSHGKGKDPRIILFASETITDSGARVLTKNPIIFTEKNLSDNSEKNIHHILNSLYERSFQTLLVEGGGITFTHFLKSEIFDELHIYFAPKMIGTGLPFYKHKRILTDDSALTIHKIKKFKNDIKIIYHKE